MEENTVDGDESSLRQGVKMALAYQIHALYSMTMTDGSKIISKRLHISGLTPAISSDDLSRRLGSFGSVTALDGLGKLDALGQPRKFAYVTLQATKPQLSRCSSADIPTPSLCEFIISQA